jgi:probable rRNA maturation factor
VVRERRTAFVRDDDFVRLAAVVAAREARAFSAAFLLVGDRRMRALHARHLGDPSTTDVMSFDLAAEGAAPEIEVAINAELAAREGRKRGHGARAELLFYAAHGLLHGLGYDDCTPARRGRMHRRQAQCLADLGIRVEVEDPRPPRRRPPRPGGSGAALGETSR